MTTKALQRFYERVGYYGSDLELCDLLVKSFQRRPNSPNNLAEDLGSNADRHPFLARRENTRQSRKICGLHLKSTLSVAFIKDLYEDFSDYLKTVMANAALKGINPSRFVGTVKIDLQATEILKLGTWDKVVQSISDEIFRKLENERSTIELIRKASGRLGLDIDQDIINAAMPFLDARHIFVHRDGIADQKYRNDYPQIEVRDNKIVANYALVSAANTAVSELASEIDAKLIGADLVRRKDIRGNR